MYYKPGSHADKFMESYWNALVRKGLASRDGNLYLPTEGSLDESCRPVE